MAKPPLTDAERQAKKRALKKAGAVAGELVISAGTRDVLVETGHLAEWDEENREAILRAAQALLDNLESVLVTP